MKTNPFRSRLLWRRALIVSTLIFVPVSFSWASPMCQDLFLEPEIRLLSVHQLFPHHDADVQGLAPNEAHIRIRHAFDRSLRALDTAMDSMPSPGANPMITSESAKRPRLDALLKTHLEMAQDLLTFHGTKFHLTTFDGKPALEIEDSPDSPLNKLSRGLDRVTPARMIYAPFSLLHDNSVGFYVPDSNEFATSSRSVRQGKVDQTFLHEGRHRYFDGRAELGSPMIFSANITWGNRENRPGIPYLDGYAEYMSVEELVTHVQDMLVLARWLPTTPAEERADLTSLLRAKGRRSGALAENTRQGMTFTLDLLKPVLKVNARVQFQPTIQTYKSSGRQFLYIALANQTGLVIDDVSGKSLALRLTQDRNNVEFLMPGDFAKLLEDFKNLGSESWSAANVLLFVKEIERQAKELITAADAATVEIEKFNTAVESNQPLKYQMFLDLASGPRRALAPWLAKPTGENKRLDQQK